MTIQQHFACATPGCRQHVHVTIICHDKQSCDLDKLGEAVGFRRRKETPTITLDINPWHCAEHAE